MLARFACIVYCPQQGPLKESVIVVTRHHYYCRSSCRNGSITATGMFLRLFSIKDPIAEIDTLLITPIRTLCGRQSSRVSKVLLARLVENLFVRCLL